MTIEYLYIHVPFCKTKCHYCDFYSTTDITLQKEWYNAIIKHFEYYKKKYSINHLKTIYIGGGSPSSLNHALLATMVHYLEKYITPDTEFSIELNPYDLLPNLFEILLDSPITRISLGIESLNDAVRNAVNRRGTGKEIKSILKKLKQYNKFILSIDMMYGLPLQTSKIIHDDIQEILELKPDHISYYELFLEDASLLAKQVEKGVVALPSIIDNENAWEIIQNSMSESGYERYEISNWALNGKYCRHNIQYWKMGSWIGLGPSAVSNLDFFNSYMRLTNTANLTAYIDDFMQPTVEQITGKTAVIEYCMMHLRKKKGFNCNDFFARFNPCYHTIPEWLYRQFPSYVYYDNEHIAVTDDGMDHLNAVIRELMKYMEQL